MILVTGAGGLIGKAVCEQLACRNENVLKIVHTLMVDVDSVVIEIDLAKENLTSAVKDEISGVVHLAAAVPHSHYYPDTKETAELTRKIDINVLRAAEDWGCPVVYMSSCGLYDRNSENVKFEDDEASIKIVSPYFSAKYDGERIFSRYEKAGIIRLAAPVGSGLKSSVVVSRFMALALAGGKLQVWGSGKREQNFIDASDVARLVNYVLIQPNNILVNAAADKPVTMIDLANLVVDVVGKGEVELPGVEDPRDGETARYSIDRAKQIYDWQPTIPLRQSLKALIGHSFQR